MKTSIDLTFQVQGQELKAELVFQTRNEAAHSLLSEIPEVHISSVLGAQGYELGKHLTEVLTGNRSTLQEKP